MAIANSIGFVAIMDQMTFSEAEYQNKKRKTRRDIFLERMDKLLLLEAYGEEGSPLLPQEPELSASVSAAWHASSSLNAVAL